jgi:hypothetical protein
VGKRPRDVSGGENAKEISKRHCGVTRSEQKEEKLNRFGGLPLDIKTNVYMFIVNSLKALAAIVAINKEEGQNARRCPFRIKIGREFLIKQDAVTQLYARPIVISYNHAYQWFSAYTNLSKLVLTDCSHLTEGLGKLLQLFPNLHHLVLVNLEAMKDCTFLKACPLLKTLKIVDGTLKSLEGLQGLKGLQEVAIESSDSLEDVSAIFGCKVLQKLVIDGCSSLVPVTNGSAVSESLRHIAIRDVPTEFYEFMNGGPPCPNVKYLDVSRNRWVDLGFLLAKFPGVSMLSLEDITYLTSLKRLKASSNITILYIPLTHKLMKMMERNEICSTVQQISWQIEPRIDLEHIRRVDHWTAKVRDGEVAIHYFRE